MRARFVLLGLALAGCATAPTRASGGWILQASATAGAALARIDDKGGDTLRIACRRAPADLLVASDAMAPGTGPAVLRVGELAVALTAGGEAPRLSATAPLPDGLPAALMSGGAVSLTHAGRTLGPFPPPDPKSAAAFVIACRGREGSPR